MPYKKFAAYNVGGAILWTVLFVGAGALLGNLPAVKHNFSIVSGQCCILGLALFHCCCLSCKVKPMLL